ncbi:hypothetical protein M3I54_37100 [Paraburkholderia sp. CNPSo 3274]|uniref:hypothetical protein n=1 Tax=unclassified Paraburkholderia TaxID=2615204 RepID=UPI0020B7FA43|nr:MULTISPECIES: hypothetical protein [unclassified Paraburkholderia]MCP3712481.1 hypothetical protein [Paraburkholderia sp. CNPSo 3274]MCP3720843.1 hypothetical protein [Paraburkholderia sp. CNPSo 3281]
MGGPERPPRIPVLQRKDQGQSTSLHPLEQWVTMPAVVVRCQIEEREDGVVNRWCVMFMGFISISFKPVRKTVRDSTEFHRPTKRTHVIHNLFQEKHAHFSD